MRLLDLNLLGLYRYLLYKFRYPNACIALGARIGKGTRLGREVKIGSNSIVFSSSIGDNSSIQHGCSIYNAELEGNNVIYGNTGLSMVRVGRFSYVGRNSILIQTTIGRFCSLGPELLCGPGEHPTNYVSSSPLFFSTLKQCGVSFSDKNYFEEKKPITIGHDVWIGARVLIRDGVDIGHGAIIGAGAIVLDDVPAYGIVGGVPAKLIRFRFSEDIIKRLLEVQWWEWNNDMLQKAQPLFAQEDVNAFLEWAYKQSS